MTREEGASFIEEVTSEQNKDVLLSTLIDTLDLRANQFHPLTFINGEPEIGIGVFVGFLSEINGKDAKVRIGDYCDIASFVAINAADSHLRCIELADDIVRSEITLEHHVFVGSHSFIGGNTHIGHHSVVASGTILFNGGTIPPYSLVIGNPAVIKPEYFKNKVGGK